MHERLKSTNNSKKTITTIKTKIVEKITSRYPTQKRRVN